MKRYKIAGLSVDMEAEGRTLKQAEPYADQSQGPADMVIKVDVEQTMALNPQLTEWDLTEYMATGHRFCELLPLFQGLMLHSSAVICGGKAYLFTAPSGTGKSTHTQKWVRLFGAQYLNDDKPALRLMDERWVAYGTPWSGKHDISSPVGVELGGIAVLTRGEENAIERLSPAEALPYIMSQTIFRQTRQRMDKQLALLDDLLSRVPVWMLTCRNDDEAAMLSHGTMVGD